MVRINILTEAKISNTFCKTYVTKAAKVTKNSTVLLLVSILLSIWVIARVYTLGNSYMPSSPLELIYS